MANVNNYVKAGNAAVRKAVSLRKTLAENALKFDDLAIEGIKADRDANVLVAKSNGLVSRAAINAAGKMEATDSYIKNSKRIKTAERNVRKAGLLAAGAQYLGAASYLSKKKDQPNEQLSLIQQQEAMFRQRMTNADADIARISQETYQKPTKPVSSDSNESTSDQVMPSNNNSSSNTSGTVAPAEVFSYLTKEKGLNKNAALGLLANIERESSFRINPPGGDNGNSFGMLQWNNTYGRSDLMKKNVPDWQTNWKGQLDHALSQNQLPEYNAAASTFVNTDWGTPQAAADYFMNDWERPADPVAGSQKHAGFISGYNF